MWCYRLLVWLFAIKIKYNKANLGGLIAATSLVISNWIQINKFSAHVTVKFDGWPKKMTKNNNRALLLYYIKLCASFQIHWWIQTGVTVQKLTLNLGRNWRYFILCDLEMWCLTMENNRPPLLYHIKLCASFQSHRWSQTWITIWKHSIWDKIGNFLSRVTLKFDLRTLKSNRAPLLYYIKLCASFQSHELIQSGVSVRKRSIQVKICNFLSCATLKFNGWPWKTTGHLSHAASSFVHHFIAVGEFEIELQSGNAQFG